VIINVDDVLMSDDPMNLKYVTDGQRVRTMWYSS